MGSSDYCKTHLAKLCLQCDEKLHSINDHWRFLLCNNCVSQKAVVQCLDKRFCLCQTCVSNVNTYLRFLCKSFNKNLSYNICSPNLDLDSSSSSSFDSFNDRNLSYICSPDLDFDSSLGSPFISFSPKSVDSSPSSDFFQYFDNYTNNYSDQQMQMLHQDYLDISRDSSCSGFNAYETKKDNFWLNTFDHESILNLPKEDFILNELLIDDIAKLEIISKDYNIEGLANPTSQMIGLKANEETNNLGKVSNAFVQFDYEPSQLILTDKMLQWEGQRRQYGRFDPRLRYEALQRYLAKKKKRKFVKKIRYESRKSTADTKRRMKGRFTKADAEYDYDPRVNNINKKIIKSRL